jgi:undecaprenyl-diphosphatase
MKAVSFAGSTPVYVAVFATVAVWLVWRRLWRLAVFVVVTMVGSSVLNGVVKQAVHRARPVLDDPLVHLSSKSFPSGHAQAAPVAYAVLLLVFLPALHGSWRRVAAAVAVVIVATIGFSRVALGAHYVSDVLAGYILGGAWVVASTAAFSAWRREEGRPGVAPAEGLEPEHAGLLDPRNTEQPASRSR